MPEGRDIEENRSGAVLIAGCGYVGCALGERLTRAAIPVYGLRRDVSSLPVGVRPVVADLTDAEGLREALVRAGLSGLEALVYAVSAADGSDDAYRAAYVDGFETLVQTLDAGGNRPRRLLYCSSTGVYGQSAGETVAEGSATRPTRGAAKLLLAGEQRATSAAELATIVRFSGIYGPGRTSLVDAVRCGRARCTRQPVWTNRIHRDDCAGVLAHLLALDAPAPLYLASDCEPALRNDVYRWIAARLGVAAPQLGDASETTAGRGSGRSKRCSNARIVASGYRFGAPSYREGYAPLLSSSL